MKGEARMFEVHGILAGLLVYPLFLAIDVPFAATVAAKGASVGLLAIAAALVARGTDSWLLAAVMALGAAGDVLLEIDFATGAASFALGHVTAMWLYLRNRREGSGGAELTVAASVLALAVVGPWFLLEGRAEQTAFAAYGALLGGMAACAWLSRFSRKMVGTGALLFVASDLLIAARLGMEARPALMGIAIWYLYFAGQLLIYLGVRRGLGEGTHAATT